MSIRVKLTPVPPLDVSKVSRGWLCQVTEDGKITLSVQLSKAVRVMSPLVCPASKVIDAVREALDREGVHDVYYTDNSGTIHDVSAGKCNRGKR